MIEKHMKKLIILTTISISIFTLSSIGASAEWKQDTNGWWYTEGSSWATGWRQIDGKWYHFASNGYMDRSTLIDKYYINDDGQWIDDSMYNVTASKAQGIVKQYFINKGKTMPQHINVEGDFGTSWGVHCYDLSPSTVTYGWYFIDKTTGDFVSRNQK